MTIVQFMTARLAEDEKVAHGLLFACRDPNRRPVFDFCGGPAAEYFWAHFTAARMLREVEAKRKILAMWQEPETERYLPTGEIVAQVAVAEAIDSVVRALAAGYSDHPDYQQEWAA
jgi:hypothetical protein